MPNVDLTFQVPALAPREPDTHKGTYGHAMIIGGSRGMTGAVALAGKAALRSGAGLVTLLVADACLATVAALEPCYMTVPLPSDEEGRIGAALARIREATQRASSIAIGPGLGRSASLDEMVRQLYAELPQPVVVDADGLNALAAAPLPSPAGSRILTPHPGEFRRLCPDAPASRPERDERAMAWAAEYGVVLVLKGHNTLITDGNRWAHNLTGNPGMATGGTGDVLTGVITALLAQGLEPFEAAHLGCHVHGLAGDLAVATSGEVALIASDLVQSLASAWISVGSGR